MWHIHEGQRLFHASPRYGATAYRKVGSRPYQPNTAILGTSGPWESVQRWLDTSPYWGAEGCVRWLFFLLGMALGVGCFLSLCCCFYCFLTKTQHGERNVEMFRVWKVTMTCFQDRCYSAAVETSSLSRHTSFNWLKSELFWARPSWWRKLSINAHRGCNHCHHWD